MSDAVLQQFGWTALFAVLVALVAVVVIRGCRPSKQTAAEAHRTDAVAENPKAPGLTADSNDVAVCPAVSPVLHFFEVQPPTSAKPSAAISSHDQHRFAFVEVVLVRHGERIDHVNAAWARGRGPSADPLDPPLSTRGEAQSAELATWWARRQQSRGSKRSQTAVTCVITSPLRRCWETAAPLAAACQCPLFVHGAAVDAYTRKVYKTAAPAVTVDAAIANAAQHKICDHSDGSNTPSDSNCCLRVWPFSAAALRASKRGRPDKLPLYPESSVDFETRCRSLVPTLIEDLAGAIERWSRTNNGHSAGSAADLSRQMRIPVDALLNAAPPSAASLSVARPPLAHRGLRLVIVTHADVIAGVLSQLAPKDRRSDLGQPSVPYASLTRLQLRRDESGKSKAEEASDTWTVECRGDTAPLDRTRVVLELQKR